MFRLTCTLLNFERRAKYEIQFYCFVSNTVVVCCIKCVCIVLAQFDSIVYVNASEPFSSKTWVLNLGCIGQSLTFARVLPVLIGSRLGVGGETCFSDCAFSFARPKCWNSTPPSKSSSTAGNTLKTGLVISRLLNLSTVAEFVKHSSNVCFVLYHCSAAL